MIVADAIAACIVVNKILETTPALVIIHQSVIFRTNPQPGGTVLPETTYGSYGTFVFRQSQLVMMKGNAVKPGESASGADPYPADTVLEDGPGPAVRQTVLNEIVFEPEVRLSMQAYQNHQDDVDESNRSLHDEPPLFLLSENQVNVNIRKYRKIICQIPQKNPRMGFWYTVNGTFKYLYENAVLLYLIGTPQDV